MESTTLSTTTLNEVMDFLNKVADTNEDTEFEPSEEYLVEAIKTLVREKQKTSITEDFDVPYIHPMITIQKWNKELRQIVAEVISERHSE